MLRVPNKWQHPPSQSLQHLSGDLDLDTPSRFRTSYILWRQYTRHELLSRTPCTPTMGTLADGTLCAYCLKNQANYIPDGCAGPVCFWPVGTSCWDASQWHGWCIVVQLRMTRFAKSTFLRLATKLHRVLSEQSIRDHICQLLIFP